MAWYLFSWKTIGGALIPKREQSLQVILTMTHMKMKNKKNTKNKKNKKNKKRIM